MQYSRSAVERRKPPQAERREREDNGDDDEKLDEVAGERRLESAEKRVDDDYDAGNADGPEKREAHPDADHGADREKLERVVEKLHRKAEDGERPAHRRRIALGDEVNRAPLGRTPPPDCEEPRAEQDDGDGNPAYGDRNPPELVGKRGIHDERKRRETVHVERHARKPPRNGLVVAEELRRRSGPAAVVDADSDHHSEKHRDDAIVN